MTIDIYKDFGPIISDVESKKILEKLNDSLKQGNNSVVVDFKGVIAMTTKSAKKIFGHLYSELTPKIFYERIKIKNASSSIQEIIYDAITNYLTNRPVRQ